MANHVVTGLLKSRMATENVLRQLDAAGFADSQVSLLMSDQTRGHSFKLVENSKADEGAIAGATFGGVTAGILAAVASAGAIAIPGLNLVVAGTLISGLAGAGAGAAVGGLLGALVGAGIPEHEAKVYEKDLSSGSILVAVEVQNDAQEKMVKNILKNADAVNVAA